MDNKRYTTFTKYKNLRRKFLERFTDPNPSGTALAQLLRLKQRRTGIQEYATKALMLCPCAGGRGRRNDNKDNHVVSGLVLYQGVVQ